MLGGDDLDQRRRLRLSCGPAPGRRGAALADPAAGELVADRRQRPPQRLADVLVAVVDAGGEAGVVPVVDRAAPSRRAVGAWACCSPRTTSSGSRSRPACSSRSAASASTGCLAAIRANGTSPANRRSAQIRNGMEPNVRVEQLGRQLGEALGLAGQPLRLGRRRRGQPDQVHERRQVALAHDRRDRCGVDDVAEQLGRPGRPGRGRACPAGSRSGPARSPRAALEDLGEQPPPDLEQVVALVEHQRDRPGLLQRRDQGPAVLVEAVQLRGRRRRVRLASASKTASDW